MPLASESQEYQIFMTPDGICTPTLVLHGTTKATVPPQSSSLGILSTFVCKHVLHWVDEILLFAASTKSVMQEFFSICLEYNVRLHAIMCNFSAHKRPSVVENSFLRVYHLILTEQEDSQT